jgi:hypothetical protein
MPLTGQAGGAILSAVKVQRLFAVAVLAIALSPAPAGSQTQDTWFGAWRLNPSKSTPSDNSRYKRVTSTIEPWEDGLRVMYDMVGTRGGVTHVEWTGRFDGKDYAVQGIDYVMTNAYSRIDNHNYSIVIKRDGQTSATVKVTISADGRVLTAVTTGKTAQGQDASTTAVYDKL